MVISRKAGLLAVVAVAGLALAGCAAGPGQAGSAAIVGNNAISLDSVQAELNSELANQPAPADGSPAASPADEARQLVTYAVRGQIVDAAVAKYGLPVPDSGVNDYINANGGLGQIVKSTGLTSDEVQSIGRQAVGLAAYADKFLSKVQMNFDVAVAQDQKTATEYASKIAADPADTKSLLQSVPGANGQVGFGQQMTGVTLLAWNSQLNDQAQQSGGQAISVLPLLAAKANTVVTFPLGGQGSWVIAVMHTYNTNGSASASDKSSLSQLSLDDLAAAGQYLLAPFGRDLGVRVSPRYGVWDAADMQVVATADQAGETLLPLRGQPTS